ncbi:MAG TPA: hypothetical protein VN923_04930, partial [Thermoanaerobaculia bacterium]|nr:hypothetical protein [Thermoanaerobaculia bacterium]
MSEDGRGHRLRWLPLVGGAALCFASALSAMAPAEPARTAPRPRVDGRLWVQPSPIALAARPEAMERNAAAAWSEFTQEAGGTWAAFVDGTSGLLEYAEGSGLPWLPGRGNSLTAADLPWVPANDSETLALLEQRARALLDQLGPAMGVDADRLLLARERSGRTGDSLWIVDFDVVLDGLAVEGAHVVFRVSHGNLVQLGTSDLPSPHAPPPRFAISREQAFATVTTAEGGFADGAVFLDAGSRRLLPSNPLPGLAGFVLGRGIAAVWELLFVHPGRPETWRARVDAETGELLELYDVNEYGQATGGAYPDTFAAANETPVPLPFVDLSTGGFADAAGTYAYSGGPLTSKLAGRYAKIDDSCGPISLAADARGNLSFGTSAGTDCATPGFGGPGNAHSSRSLYAWVADIQRVARGWMPDNAWLDTRLPVYPNIDLTCNAFWNGS